MLSSTHDHAPGGWRIWRSDTGRFWATRTAEFPRAAEFAGAARTVTGGTLVEVCRRVAAQEATAAVAAAS